MSTAPNTSADALPLSGVMDRRAMALRLAAEGLWLFPVRRDSKLPAHRGWQQEASRDLATISRRFGLQSQHNLGLSTEKFGDDEALLVVDLDVRQNKDGWASWHALCERHGGAPDTREHRTPSGGAHLIFRTPRPVRSSAGRLGVGIDIRSRGGLIIGPGSTINGSEYRVVADLPIAEAPRWLTEACGQPRERERKTPTTPAVPVDAAAARERGIAYLKEAAPLAVEGQGGDATAFGVVCRLKDFGLTADEAFELLLAHWNPRCSPAWTDEDLRVKIANAYRYGQEPIGSAAPETQFTPTKEAQLAQIRSKLTPEQRDFFGLDDPAPEPVVAPAEPAQGFPFEAIEDAAPDLNIAPLVEGLLDCSTAALLYGATNTGKTFLSIDLAFAVATGGRWLGRQAAQGLVVYIAGEGARGIRKRAAAWQMHHGISGGIPLALVSQAIPVTDAACAQQVIATIRAAERRFGQAVKLLILDTLGRMLSGKPQNEDPTISAFYSTVGRVIAETGATCLAIHHSGKDKNRGARGSGVLVDNADSVLAVADDGKSVTVEKQREMEYGPTPLRFGLKQVMIGRDADGKPVFSCVVVAGAAADFQPQGRLPRPKGHAGEILKLLEDLTLGAPGRAVTIEAARKEFISRGFKKDADYGRQVFRRGCDNLGRDGWVEAVQDRGAEMLRLKEARNPDE